MAKDPAFLFYPGDFTTGTQFFTDEQVGKYIRLLMAQHQLGHLEEKHMIMICKSYDNDVFSKFDKDSDNKYFNKRLEDEIVKRKIYTESRGNNKRGKKIISKSYDNDMEDENENKDINKNTILSNIRWCDEICIKQKLKSHDEVGIRLDEFNSHLLSISQEHTTASEYKKHFNNWLRKQPPIQDPTKPKMVY
jgi:uncharacterized protein YdaU (DUF1376 family)